MSQRIAITLILSAAMTMAVPSPSALAAGPSVPAALNVCGLVSAAKVSSLTGRTYASGTPQTIAAGVDSCHYAASQGYALTVTVYGSPSRSTLESLVFDIGGAKSAASVNGMGDQAFSSPVGVVAKFGDHLLEVASPATAGSSRAAIPGYINVAKAVIAAIH